MPFPAFGHSSIDGNVKRIGPMTREEHEGHIMNGLTNELVSFDKIDSIFLKDDLVLREDEIGQLWLFKLIEVTYTSNWVRGDEYDKKANFETWCLNWDAVEGHLSKTYMTFTCTEFSGWRPIKSLPVYPIDRQGQIEGQNSEQYLAERGKKWWEFINIPPTCRQHSGLAFSKDRGNFNGEKVRVGKTLTAESIAEAVQKPLVAMSIGEMVWDETQLQERLKSEFQRAIDWNAVLLLDEADVVLEARSFEDVRRNGIVSIFLRELEYYQGILFLTTNRVSTMDTAFQSRIQIGISFSSMSSDTRAKVWTQLLTLNGRDKLIGLEGLKKVQDELSKYELNGRQIRNVLNVAEGLAFQEPGAKKDKLTYEHIEEAVRAATEFQKLLEESKSMMKLEQTVWAPVTGGDDDSVF
ncbi:hypothetical protein TrVFT333_001067 [Trichoderma virens FT-333]|nr:hypothetical protein TrVFT333_001067 [Trichoderma virens FT-333]